MDIAIIAHLKHAIREPFAGGLEMHTHLLATSLRARGHAVTLFALHRSDAATGLETLSASASSTSSTKSSRRSPVSVLETND